MSITLVNSSNQQLTVDQWTIPPGGQQPVPAISPNAIVAKNQGLLQIVVANDGTDDATVFNPISSNLPLSSQELAAVYGALTAQVSGVLQFDASASSGWVFNLVGNVTAVNNPTNLTPGQRFTLEFVQDATGSRTLPAKGSWGSAWTFVGGTAPTLSTAAHAVDKLDAFYDGTKIRVSAVQLAFS